MKENKVVPIVFGVLAVALIATFVYVMVGFASINRSAEEYSKLVDKYIQQPQNTEQSQLEYIKNALSNLKTADIEIIKDGENASIKIHIENSSAENEDKIDAIYRAIVGQ